MILDCVLTASNLNEVYVDFIPIFIKTWKKLIPKINIIIILISDKLPFNLRKYSSYIILFPEIKGIKTSFISQYIRLLYPCLLTQFKNGILITDIDMLPMNSSYYIDNIKNFTNDKFISYRNTLIKTHQEVAMCYNIATSNIWKNIFNINNINEINEKLISLNNEYNGKIPWELDQLHLYSFLKTWNDKNPDNWIILTDEITNFNRLDRITYKIFKENSYIDDVKNLKYTDYHMHRPYKENILLINKIVDLLPNNKIN